MPTYPDTILWSNTHHVEIATVDPNIALDSNTGLRPRIVTLLQQTHIFDANLQEKLLLEYKRNSERESQEYSKFLLANKKGLITIIFGQCDEATKTKIALGATYTGDCQAGRLIKFLNCLHTVYFGGDDGGLSYAPYKQLTGVWLVDNWGKLVG